LSLICVGVTVHAWEAPSFPTLLTNAAAQLQRMQNLTRATATQVQTMASNAVDKVKQIPLEVVTVVSLLEKSKEEIVNVFAVWKEPINRLLDKHRDHAEGWIIKLVILKHPHLATINSYSLGHQALRWMVRQ